MNSRRATDRRTLDLRPFARREPACRGNRAGGRALRCGGPVKKSVAVTEVDQVVTMKLVFVIGRGGRSASSSVDAAVAAGP